MHGGAPGVGGSEQGYFFYSSTMEAKVPVKWRVEPYAGWDSPRSPPPPHLRDPTIARASRSQTEATNEGRASQTRWGRYRILQSGAFSHSTAFPTYSHEPFERSGLV